MSYRNQVITASKFWGQVFQAGAAASTISSTSYGHGSKTFQLGEYTQSNTTWIWFTFWDVQIYWLILRKIHENFKFKKLCFIDERFTTWVPTHRNRSSNRYQHRSVSKCWDRDSTFQLKCHEAFGTEEFDSTLGLWSKSKHSQTSGGSPDHNFQLNTAFSSVNFSS